jgi:hypothetical protein
VIDKLTLLELSITACELTFTVILRRAITLEKKGVHTVVIHTFCSKQVGTQRPRGCPLLLETRCVCIGSRITDSSLYLMSQNRRRWIASSITPLYPLQVDVDRRYRAHESPAARCSRMPAPTERIGPLRPAPGYTGTSPNQSIHVGSKPSLCAEYLARMLRRRLLFGVVRRYHPAQLPFHGI